MHANRMVAVVCFCLLSAVAGNAAGLPCVKPGVDRWPIKTTLPDGATAKKMTLTAALNLARLTNVKTDDPRYKDARITDQPVKEDAIVTLSGYVYLVGFESDDCDFHIQLTVQPLTAAPTTDDNSMIVEAPSETYAVTISSQVEGVRQWVIDNLLAKKTPTIGHVYVMQHAAYVTVTGALFYDDAHSYEANGGTGRGKKGLESKTLWELHPVTKIAFAPAPK
jgi:hypothetical protein